ncbi:hypothetical protein QYF61_012363 [Mycteria americana]|uniref:Uncharacterized protein n=1 Tax=Mycteria americana TaxID=33587 RepID=A0AAN7S9F8_MYCAM|nr:hypothetical protein QYF61_012363 [Mycteria americana]
MLAALWRHFWWWRKVQLQVIHMEAGKQSESEECPCCSLSVKIIRMRNLRKADLCEYRSLSLWFPAVLFGKQRA